MLEAYDGWRSGLGVLGVGVGSAVSVVGVVREGWLVRGGK